MNRVVLDCKGRLANQILCWANARHVLTELGLTDKIIVINYPIPPDTAVFPGAICEVVDTNRLPVVTRNELGGTSQDCLWLWSDLYSRFPSNINDTIRTIQLTENFSRSLDLTVGNKKFIGIHARFGDYVRVDSRNPSAAMPPFVRGSDDYFAGAVRLCLEKNPESQFYLASDGNDKELAFLTNNKAVLRGKIQEPIFDLFALSRCKFIIGSGSTFSSCAAAYGQIPLIIPSTQEPEIRSIISSNP